MHDVLHDPFWTSHLTAAALTLIVALWELRTGRIPTSMVALGLATGALLVVQDGAIGTHALGLLIAFVPGFQAFRSGHIGGGGAKWFAALGWMVGTRTTLLVWAVLLTALLALVLRRRLGPIAPFTVPSAPTLLVAFALATAIERSPLCT